MYNFSEEEIKERLIYIDEKIKSELMENEIKKQNSIKEGEKLLINTGKPYSNEEYKEAKKKGLDLDNWNDYVKYFGIGEEDDNYFY